MLVDTDSKNGCAVDGHSTKRAVLTDGALIELGHTMFVYYEKFEIAADAPICTEVTPTELPATLSLLTSWQTELARIKQVAASEIPILVEGESGVGKEIIARAIHTMSGRITSSPRVSRRSVCSNSRAVT